MGRFMVAAAHKSSGKTVISTGLAAALTARGQVVQCFKKGPDYIDPMWLSAASGRPCYNLDFNTMDVAEFTTLMCDRATNADLAMIEANKGLFDGLDTAGTDSNAALAKALKTPVVLVIDTGGMTRGIAPLLLGYQAFDNGVNIAGVILNKLGGARHESKLRAAVETYTDIPVLGAVGRDRALDIGERHLGLTTPTETQHLDATIAGFAAIVGASVDLDAICEIANSAPALKNTPPAIPQAKYKGLKIAIARDRAFGFYYADDLEAFTALGAELVPFNAMEDGQLPQADGLFLGGGFPETHMAKLSANAPLRADIKSKLDAGLPCYAECGGLMYLCKTMSWHDQSFDMCDVIKADTVMCRRPQGRGYVVYSDTGAHPWGQKRQAQAHEFHYARLGNLAGDVKFARNLTRGSGIDGQHDGIVTRNVLAGFCHQRNTRGNPWVARFLEFVKSVSA